MKYMKKKKLIAVMALLIVAVSFGGCNSSNTAAAINSELTSSEIVSSEAVSSAPVSSEEEKPESEAVSSEAAASSAAEVSSKAEAPATSSEPAMSSAPTAVSQPVASSAQAVTSESAVTSKPAASTPVVASQPVSSTASSAPPAKTVSAPTQQSGSTKAFEDMTEEELDQWMLDQLERLNNQPIEVHEYGTDGGTGGNAAKSTQLAEGAGDVYEAIRLINEERVKAGLNELEIDSTLMEMTAVRAKEITVVYDHVRPNGSYLSTIFDEFGYGCYSAVENIYGVPDTASKAVAGWMNSPKHKDNILSTSITKIGVGYYFYDSNSVKHYWVMIGTD